VVDLGTNGSDGALTYAGHQHDIFYVFGHDLFPTLPARGTSFNVYEYCPLPHDIKTAVSHAESRSYAAVSKDLVSSYDALAVREDQQEYEKYMHDAQPAVIDMVKEGRSIPTIKHLKMRGTNSTLGAFVMHGAFAGPFRRFSDLALPVIRKKHLSIASDDFSGNVAVIVEPQITDTFELAVRSVMYHLGPDWSLLVICSEHNEAFVKASLSDVLGSVRLVTSHEALNSVNDYNALLKKLSFWKSLKAARALIFQSDALMLRDGIEDFMQYDYIGAPWDLDHNTAVKNMIENGELIRGVGNGGFSLRNVDAMISILASQQPEALVTSEPEDLFFSRHLDSGKHAYIMPSRLEAYRFCREEIISALDQSLSGGPLALHAAWKYAPSNAINELLKVFWQSLVGNTADEYAIKPSYYFKKGKTS
jgi:Protein of unknown function (DUF5672)